MHLSPRNPRVVMAASALALIVALFFFIYTHLYAIQVAALAKAHELVQSALEESLGRKVTVGAITSGGLHSVVVADVVVPAGPGEGAGDPVLAARQVIVKYSLLDIVFRRKPLVETITSVTLVEPVARAGRAPDGRIWPYGLLDSSRLFLSGGGVQGFSGSVSVRGGRLEFSGVPGVAGTVAVEGIDGTLSFAGTGLAWRASARAGPKGELHLAATGTFDAGQRAFACDATISGAMPADLLDTVRRVLKERPDLLSRTGAGPGPEVLAWLDAAGKADLAGGKVQVDVHIRPDQDGGRLVRGEVSLAETRLSAKDPAPGVKAVQGIINLASEFQVDRGGFSCQGKASVSVERAECEGVAAGLGRFEAGGQAVVGFWQRAGEDLCFEGRADLDTSCLSMGDVLHRALVAVPGSGAMEGGSLKVDGPLDVSLAFAGRASKGVDVRGKVAMAGGRVLAEDIAPEIASVAGDIDWQVEFARDAKGALTYTGKVRTGRSSVKTGLIAGEGGFAGYVSAAFTFSGATGSGSGSGPGSGLGREGGPGKPGASDAGGPEGPAAGAGGRDDEAGGQPGRVSVAMVPAYNGQVTILSGTVLATHPAFGLTSAKGAVTGSVSISGKGASGPAKYSGTLRFSGASLTMARPQAGLESFETDASGSVEFEGEYPGRTCFKASCAFSDGAIEIVNAPGIASASGKVSGKAILSGNLPGDVEYSGHVDLVNASARLLDIPGGIRSLSGTWKVATDFAGSSSTGLRYSGTAELVAGQVAAANMPGGIRGLKGSVSGSTGFKGAYPGIPELEGTVSVRDADLSVGEIPGVVRSLSGRVTGEISFRTRDGNVEEYSGKAVVGPATFVSDGVYPGVSTARGPVKLDVEFSSAGGELAYRGKAIVGGAELRAGSLFPGLVDIGGKVESSFDFESTPEGVEYMGLGEDRIRNRGSRRRGGPGAGAHGRRHRGVPGLSRHWWEDGLLQWQSPAFRRNAQGGRGG